MTGRERLLTALAHEEPDRAPIDLGSMRVTGINALAYAPLREAMSKTRRGGGIAGDPVRIFDVNQLLAVVEEPVREAFGVDVAPVHRLKPAFGVATDRWEPGVLPDGTPCLYPEGFRPVPQPDGSWHYYEDGILIARRPASCPYFELARYPLAEAQTPEEIDAHTFPAITDREVEFLKAQVRYWRENSDYGLVGQFAGNMMDLGLFMFGQQRFLEMMALEPDLVKHFFNRAADWHVSTLRVYLEAVGTDLDVIQMADDLGGQQGPLISLDMYRRLLQPAHARVYGFIRENFHGTLLMHNCGSIRQFLPDLIEAGVQAINPVQVTAAHMDPQGLKRDFGKHLVFWGGGSDTQTVLPFGTPAEVVSQVRERMEVFSPGGGFVFASVHIIQPGTSPENIIATFETARDWSRGEG